MTRLLKEPFMIAICCVAAFATAQQEPARKVVIVNTPGKDILTWKNTLSREAPDTSTRTLRSKFPEDQYIMVEEKNNWVFFFDRDLERVKFEATREHVFKAFLAHADMNGVVRWGDLSDEIKNAALNLFTSSALAIRAMGEKADEIRIAIESDLWMEAATNDRTISMHMFGGLSLEASQEVATLLGQHSVPHLELTPKIMQVLEEQALEDNLKRRGISTRFIGAIFNNQELEASRKALDALDRYLRTRLADTTKDMESLVMKYLGDKIPEFGGLVPRSTFDKNSVPARLWKAYANDLRFTGSEYGIANTDEAEQFLANVTTIRFQVAFTMSYVKQDYTDADGRKHQGFGLAVQLIKW